MSTRRRASMQLPPPLYACWRDDYTLLSTAPISGGHYADVFRQLLALISW
jgi:hypothetical protein